MAVERFIYYAVDLYLYLYMLVKNQHSYIRCGGHSQYISVKAGNSLLKKHNLFQRNGT